MDAAIACLEQALKEQDERSSDEAFPWMISMGLKKSEFKGPPFFGLGPSYFEKAQVGNRVRGVGNELVDKIQLKYGGWLAGFTRGLALNEWIPLEDSRGNHEMSHEVSQ